ncbi:MAG: hypothetical protein RL701_2044 [Pseudomonadota bacterium]|jgi:uncharacterized membrane protein
MHTRRSPQRWLALDILRGLAVLLMIQGHTFTALLRASEYDGAWSRWHSLVHGLTAPMFLIGGGLAYGFVVMRDSQQPGLRLVRRGLMLLALGYLLQFPNASPSAWLRDPVLLAGALRVGPLQLIGACLLICEAVRAVTRTRMQLMATLCVQALVIALSAPVVWKVRASQGALLPLGTWFDGYAGSLFPFFPWAVFFLLGVSVSFGVLLVLENPAAMRLERLAALTMLAVGVLATSLTYAAFVHGRVLSSWYGEHELWHTSPLYVVFRAGAVLAGLGLLWVMEPWLRQRWRSNGRLETLLSAISRHSLVAYVAHLLVLYGTPFTSGLTHDGPTLSIWQASAVSALLIAFTLGIVLAWQHSQRVRALPVTKPA